MNSFNPKTDLWSRVGLDRKKLIMIVALSLVLIVVLVIQFGGSSPAVSVPNANRTTLREPVLKSKKSKLTSHSNSPASQKSPTRMPRSYKKDHKQFAVQEPDPIKQTESRTSSANASSDTFKDFMSLNLDFESLKAANPFELPGEIERMREAQEQQRKRELAAKAKREREQAALEYHAKVETAIRKLQQEGIRLVFIQGEDRAAQIGSRVVKIGDIIDGVRIAEIRENGSVILEVPEFELAQVSSHD